MPAGLEALRRRLDAGLRQIAFFVVPSAMAFLALGDVVAAALLQTGRFGHADAVYVWGILAGSAVGLLASTLGRLYSSTYYALRDTRTPLRYAIVRVALTTVLGYLFAIPLPRLLGVAAGVGRRGTDGVGRRRRLGRDAAAAPDAERAHRPNRACRRPTSHSCGIRDCRRGASRGASSSRCRRCIRSCRDPRPRSVRPGVLRDDAGRASHPRGLDRSGASEALTDARTEAETAEDAEIA